MKPRSAWVAKWFLPARASVVPRPLGVVGIIVPWNYPLFLAVSPLVAAIVAGNRAMVKMSEFTPTFSALFQQLIGVAFRTNEVAVITGGADVAAQFSALPFDHLLFTGSSSVGRKVMTAASHNLTPVTLELGGKSPAVMAPGFDRPGWQRVLAQRLKPGQRASARYALGRVHTCPRLSNGKRRRAPCTRGPDIPTTEHRHARRISVSPATSAGIAPAPPYATVFIARGATTPSLCTSC